ncbi:unnamed protein product [Musa textilis]
MTFPKLVLVNDDEQSDSLFPSVLEMVFIPFGGKTVANCSQVLISRALLLQSLPVLVAPDDREYVCMDEKKLHNRVDIEANSKMKELCQRKVLLTKSDSYTPCR